MTLPEYMLIVSAPVFLFGTWAAYDTWRMNRARKKARAELDELEALGTALNAAESAIRTAKAELASLREKTIRVHRT